MTTDDSRGGKDGGGAVDDGVQRVDGHEWTVEDLGPVTRYAHDVSGGRRTEVRVEEPADGPPTVDIVGPHAEPARSLLDAEGIEIEDEDEDENLTRWDRIESGAGVWFASHDGDRRMFYYTEGEADVRTEAVASLGDEGVVDLRVEGPEIEGVLERFDRDRADEWVPYGVDDPADHVAENRTLAAEAEWETDRGTRVTVEFDDEGALARATAEGPSVDGALEAFDDADRTSRHGRFRSPGVAVDDDPDIVRFDRWRVRDVENPGERVVSSAGEAAVVEWSTDGATDATMSFDPDGRAVDLLLDGPDPETVDPERGRRAQTTDIRHVATLDADAAARQTPVVSGVEWRDGEPRTRAVTTAAVSYIHPDLSDRLQSATHVEDLVDDETARDATAALGVVERLREADPDRLSGDARFLQLLDTDPESVRGELEPMELVVSGPHLDDFLDEQGADYADTWVAWHVDDDPRERAATAVAADADTVVWGEQAAAGHTVHETGGIGTTRCAVGDDRQSFVVHVDGEGRETYGHLDRTSETPVAAVAGPNDALVAAELGVDPDGVERTEGTLVDRVLPAESRSLTDRIDEERDTTTGTGETEGSERQP